MVLCRIAVAMAHRTVDTTTDLLHHRSTNITDLHHRHHSPNSPRQAHLSLATRRLRVPKSLLDHHLTPGIATDHTIALKAVVDAAADVEAGEVVAAEDLMASLPANTCRRS